MTHVYVLFDTLFSTYILVDLLSLLRHNPICCHVRTSARDSFAVQTFANITQFCFLLIIAAKIYTNQYHSGQLNPHNFQCTTILSAA
jgi:hypothetical protein